MNKYFIIITICLLMGAVRAYNPDAWPYNSQLNYSFSNCQTQQVGSNTVFVNVSISNLNASGLYCSILVNDPWYSAALLLVIYISVAFLFSYLKGARLLLIISASGFVFASLLWMYGFVAPGIWIETMMFLVFSMIIYYMLGR